MKSNMESTIPLDRRCTILKYDEAGIWFIDKAVGVLSHPNKESKKGKTARTILNAEYFFDEECYRWENSSGRITKYLPDSQARLSNIRNNGSL